ncbi:unnamed protein product [Pylaiella littoralis]
MTLRVQQYRTLPLRAGYLLYHETPVCTDSESLIDYSISKKVLTSSATHFRSRRDGVVAEKTGACLSEPARRWAKLRQNFRLAALRSIAQDKREALEKLQEVRKRADKAQEAQSDSRTCKICWDRATNTVCLDCGHQCMCTRCGACMTFCPICMQDISDLVELQ